MDHLGAGAIRFDSVGSVDEVGGVGVRFDDVRSVDPEFAGLFNHVRSVNPEGADAGGGLFNPQPSEYQPSQ